MTTDLSHYRKRTFYYSWCDRTEIDYVCRHCETVILDTAAGCQWCKRGQAAPLAPGEKRPNPGLEAMHEIQKTRPPKEKKPARVKVPSATKPAGYVNPGILRMREINRLRNEAKKKG
jgi:hypothetical protein